MKHLLFLLLSFYACNTFAQIDVTANFLQNFNFDSNFHHVAGETTNVTKEIKNISGWNQGFTVDYTVTGVYEYGFAGKFNDGEVPAKGYMNSTGGALALSTGWEVSMTYYQNVTLPAGSYTIKVPTYSAKSATKGSSQLAWIPNTGESVFSTLNGYPSKTWSLDQISFTLTKETKGKIQIGYKAAGGGSGSSANILIDYVQVLVKSYEDSRNELNVLLNQAVGLYNDGEGKNADLLKVVLDRAKEVYDNTNADLGDILQVTKDLKEAIDSYSWDNASEEYPVDCTFFIVNPSFEIDGTNGWSTDNMSLQTNSVFKKTGNAYAQAWTSIGNKIGNASISQTIKNLPKGKYILKANALHIQQNGSGSTTNNGAAQRGAALFAAFNKITITSMKNYSVNFAVVDDNGEVEIGVIAENATGNYLCVDDFHLFYVGEIENDNYVIELQAVLNEAIKTQSILMQDFAAQQLTQTIEAANNALEGNGVDENGNIIYDFEQVKDARDALIKAIAQAEESNMLYTNLQKRIDYAENVLKWWKGLERKASAWNVLNNQLQIAKNDVKDTSLSVDQLNKAITSLNSRISNVDKKIYCSGSACGSDSQLQDNNNQWSYLRSFQSKHWVLFWEKEYGNEAPEPVEGILETADKIFEMYANELGFLTIDQGKSKTDTYKMIIRLKSTGDWIAEGSGIDNQIGMLTLSRWAYTSRGGQTVAHEIGHCFQYQVHCDNNDWNGWMYNWGNSNMCSFWEMCAQWQAYKYYPGQQVDNEWFWNTINGMHRHPLCRDLRYNNYFIQDYFCHKHGMDIVGKLWNACKDPEDPFQTYMRITMTGTTAKKINQLGDELWEYGARMMTFDLDPIRDRGTSKTGTRKQTDLTKDSDGFWWPTKSICIENWGNNAIRLNAPNTNKTIYVEFEGKAGAEGYNSYNKAAAGWKIGFVAYKSNGTRYYSDITTATYNDAEKTISFDCPAGCQYVWLVISGAPTKYWTRDWIGWGEEQNVEQWPYRVKFYQTNVYGNANNNSLPTDIENVQILNSNVEDDNVYALDGRIVRQHDTSLEGLPHGIYIIRNKKVVW